MAQRFNRRFSMALACIRAMHGLLAFVTFTACGVLPTWAQTSPPWQSITASERGQFYIDPTSVRKTAGVVRFKTLLDYSQPQMTHNGKAFRSAMSSMEIDCASDTGRITQMNYYTGVMAGGQQVETQGMVQDWQDIDPESPVRRMAQRVCR
jgi:hypothetical protein